MTTVIVADTLPCPHCNEPIKAAAKICRHCRADLVATPTRPPTAQVLTTNASSQPKNLVEHNKVALKAPASPTRQGTGPRTQRSSALAYPSTGRRRFPEISSLAYQHPRDLEALEALKRIPLAATVFRKLSEWFDEKAHRVHTLGTHLRIGPRQLPRLYGLFVEAAEILDMPIPEVFVETNSESNAYASGMNAYTITITSALIENFTEEELLFVIGHELSHIKCEHMLYQTIAVSLAGVGLEFIEGLIGGAGQLVTKPLNKALSNWRRNAELSCDRAGLLVVQDVAVASRALMKLGGFPGRRWSEEINYDEVLEQAREHQKLKEGVVESYELSRLVLTQTHPFPVNRAGEISSWAATDYPRIMSGEYINHERAALMRTGPMACPRCGASVQATHSTCPGCGQLLARPGQHAPPPMPNPESAGNEEPTEPCSNCGAAVTATWKFCRNCGNQRHT